MFGKNSKKSKNKWFNDRTKAIDPDEIFLDSSNLPQFDQDQFEGRMEKPIPQRSIIGIYFVLALICVLFIFRLYTLQIKQGQAFAQRSIANSLRNTVIFPDRGVIYDRNNNLLAWNVENPNDPAFSLRMYATTTGISNLLGYIKYPSKDSSGNYYRADYIGIDGVEKFYNDQLKGQNGTQITETNALGKVESGSVVNPPQNGTNLVLSIDSRIQSHLYDTIEILSHQAGFTGGAGVIIDVHTGEVLTEVTYPEYNSQVMSDGTNTAQIQQYFNNKENPFLDRASSGLYTPGSVIKPFMAMGALAENIIDPNKIIYTTGSISVPNPYNPGQKTVFKDWQNQGPLDMRKAIQESSDVYFYEIGGGYGDQKGLGILNIEKYTRMFGFGSPVNSNFFGDKKGVIPDPAWKKLNFNGEDWRIGDTYHTAIGQYGFQVTPLQEVRAIAAIANGGTLLAPTILAGDTSLQHNATHINLAESSYQVVREGMRQSAMMGTAKALNIPQVEIAAKTGTAQLGVSKDFVNSWVTGFFPYRNPRYAFVIMMEHGPVHNLIGAPYVSRQLFDWMVANTPEYLQNP